MEELLSKGMQKADQVLYLLFYPLMLMFQQIGYKRNDFFKSIFKKIGLSAHLNNNPL